MDCIEVNYNDMLAAPAADIVRLNEFLGGSLDTAAMSAVVDKNLYRQRK
jgi:hypothetical protein